MKMKVQLPVLVVVLVLLVWAMPVPAYADTSTVYDVTVAYSSTREQVRFDLISNRSSLLVQVSTSDGVVHDHKLSVASWGGKWVSWLNLSSVYGTDTVAVKVSASSQISLSDWRDPDADGWYMWLPLKIVLVEPAVVRPGGTITITGSFNETTPPGAFVALDYLNSVFPRPTAEVVSWLPDQIVAVIPADISPLMRDGWSLFVGHWIDGYISAISNTHVLVFSGPNAVAVRSFEAHRCWFRLFCK
jgi:hypothetical protein